MYGCWEVLGQNGGCVFLDLLAHTWSIHVDKAFDFLHSLKPAECSGRPQHLGYCVSENVMELQLAPRGQVADPRLAAATDHLCHQEGYTVVSLTVTDYLDVLCL